MYIISVEEELIWIHIFNMRGCMYMYIYTLPLQRFESYLLCSQRLHLFDQNEIKTVETIILWNTAIKI